MKRALLTLATLAVAAAPILASAQSERGDDQHARSQADKPAKPAKQGQAGAGHTAAQPGYTHPGAAQPGPVQGRGGQPGYAAHPGYEARPGYEAHPGYAARQGGGTWAGGRVTVYDRSNPNWWRGRPEFHDYNGWRAGYWYVPGFGYRSVPGAWWGYNWGIGVVVPGLFFNDSAYYVADPYYYGLPPARWGQRWMYLGPNLALVNVRNGRILRLVPHVF